MDVLYWCFCIVIHSLCVCACLWERHSLFKLNQVIFDFLLEPLELLVWMFALFHITPNHYTQNWPFPPFGKGHLNVTQHETRVCATRHGFSSCFLTSLGITCWKPLWGGGACSFCVTFAVLAEWALLWLKHSHLPPYLSSMHAHISRVLRGCLCVLWMTEQWCVCVWFTSHWFSLFVCPS